MRRRTFLLGGTAAGALAAVPSTAVAAPTALPPVCLPRSPWTTNPLVISMPPARHETEHFALRWRGDDVTPAQAAAGGALLEEAWAAFMAPAVAWTEPYGDRAVKHRVDVHVDPTFGLSGGTSPEGGMAAWIGPLGLQDPFGLAHELTHALQGATGGLEQSPYAAFFFETHANYMATQLPRYRQFLHGSEMLFDHPHQHLGTSRNHYLSFMVLEHLKQRLGPEAISGIWTSAPREAPEKHEADPWSVLARQQGWSQAQLDDVLGGWALRSVTYDYVDRDGTDRGPLMRRTYGGLDDCTGDRRLRVTELDLLDAGTRTYGVPFTWAPQRWGYNLVRLRPDVGVRRVIVSFTGEVQTAAATTSLPGWPEEPAQVRAPAPGWRWSVVAVGADGAPRYSPLQRGARATLAVDVRTDDQGLYLVVMGAPTVAEKVRFDQPAHSIYRYPWRVSLAGATADDGRAALLAAYPGSRRHANGGGWVAPDASVASTAYVGPAARVVGGRVEGRARVEGHATVQSGTVRGEAVVRGISVVRGRAVVEGRAVVDTTFRGVGAYGEDVVVGGTAHLVGDVELWASEVVRGTFSGFTDDDTVRDGPGRTMTGPVPEVTARPTWAV